MNHSQDYLMKAKLNSSKKKSAVSSAFAQDTDQVYVQNLTPVMFATKTIPLFYIKTRTRKMTKSNPKSQ